MKDLWLLIPIAAITVGPLTWAFTTWVRAKHGYPLDSDDGENTGILPVSRQTELLSAENERLTQKISRLEERLAVLERIATDPAERTAREIDALR